MTRAGFGPRAAAYIIDRALLFLALLGLKAPFAFAALLGAGQLTAKNFLFRFSVLDVICWLAAAAYFVLLTYFTGGTLGKKILKLCVLSTDGARLRFIDVLYRETVGRFLSGILCIGYLMALVDKRSRALHDWICETSVVYDEVAFRPRPEKAARSATPEAAWSVPGAESAEIPEPVWSVPGAESGEIPEPAEGEEGSDVL